MIAALAITAVAGACERVPVRTFDETSSHDLRFHHLTRDAGDGYATLAVPGSVQVSAPATNRGSNTRLVMFPGDQPVVDEHQACATWQTQDGTTAQQGLALRIRHDLPQDRWRAVTVTKNVMWGANWQFNVLTWDSRSWAPWQVRGSVDLSSVFWPRQQLVALPWRVCARVEGDTVRVKGWRASQPEPAWDDPVHSGSVRLPAEWVYPGKAGWYVGHLAPGQSTSYADLTLDRLEIRAE